MRLLNDFHRNHPQPTRKTSLGESADSCCSTGASTQLLEPPPAAPPRRAKRDRSPSPASHQQQQRPRQGKKVRERDRLRPLTTIRPLSPQPAVPCTPRSSSHVPCRDGAKQPLAYPSRADLYRSCHMKVELGRYWRTESTYQYCIFLAVKSDYLSPDDVTTLCATAKPLQAMAHSVQRSRHVDFSPLRQPRYDYAEQTMIDPARVRMLEACSVHYKLDFGLVVRYLGGEYTAEHRDVDALEREVSPHIPPADMAQMRRILTKGCPHTLNFEMNHEDKMKMIDRGNQPAVGG